MKHLLFSLSLLILSSAQAQVFVYDTMDFAGLERNWFVYEPENFDPLASSPLVLNLHGAGSTAVEQAIYSQFNFVADTTGVLVVYPNATENFWNSGFDSISAFLPDDVAFLTALIDTIKTRYNIDDNRVYTMGMSNGGFMSYRLVCETANIFAAMASVTGSMTESVFTNCAPGDGPVPVLQMHGTSDNTVAYEGSPGVKAIEDVIDFWTDFNDCPDVAISELPDITVDATTVQLQRYYICQDYSEVMLYKIQNGGHTWPGSFPIPGFGNTNQDINAEVEIWRFFERHSLDQQFTGMEDLPELNLTVSPNPFTNRILINPELKGRYTVRIFDLSGRLQLSTSGKGSVVLEPHLESGVYFLEIGNEKYRAVERLVRH